MTVDFNNKKSNKYNKNKNKNTKHNNKINNNITNNNNNNNNNTYYYKPSIIQIFNVQIGERSFCLSSESLNNDAPNFFTAAFFGYFSEAKSTNIFIERDPTYFSMIIRYLRGYEVDWPINEKTSMKNLLADVKYYGFERLQNLLEEIYEKNFPENVIPWKILTYASESDPVVAINVKDVELARWNSQSLIYDTSKVLKTKKPLINNGEGDNSDSDDTLAEVNANNDDVTANAAADDNNANDGQNDNANNVIVPDPDKCLYRLEIHGKDASATVTSNWNNGIKFENFTLKDSEEEKIFCKLTESFRTPEGSLNLTPSLKLPFLKDACIEIDGSKYYTYNDLSTYFGVPTRGKPLYFEEIVVRIDEGVFLMRARARTIPFYYASQPFVHSVQSRKI
ncbi:hypothetical protein C1645_739579 [Glomus cerebriforme]|uniref:Potassium channel tetramerisation-type BTB domain-containing protein n=1 Tax=Glomus cerebriforme TaxID=658196 RepID=A0A397SWF9_9GLOM|nr:hypothetical protein C1645_739579 [Glomus cerebriforme]